MFHLSLPCKDVEATKAFYLSIPGVKLGRHQPNWADINLFGNQLTFVEITADLQYPSYRFEDAMVPSFHFGLVMEDASWERLKSQLEVSQDVVVTTFLAGKKGEHSSFFLKDPDGYTIEFKNFSWEGEEFEQ